MRRVGFGDMDTGEKAMQGKIKIKIIKIPGENIRENCCDLRLGLDLRYNTKCVRGGVLSRVWLFETHGYTDKPTHTAHTCTHMHTLAYLYTPHTHACTHMHMPAHTQHNAFACTYVDTHDYTCMHCPCLLSNILPRDGGGGPQDWCYRGLAQGPQEEALVKKAEHQGI